MNKPNSPEIAYQTSPEDFRKGRLAGLEDHTLVARTLSGEDDAFEILMKRYTPIVIGFLHGKTNNPCDTEDLSQEIFLKAFRYLHTLRSSEQFAGWLMRIARSRLVDYYRRNCRRPQLVVLEPGGDGSSETDPLEQVGDPSEGADRKARHKELQSIVIREIGNLSDGLRAIVSMRLIGEQSTAEIARELGMKESAVRMRAFRGLKALRKSLERCGIGIDSAV